MTITVQEMEILVGSRTKLAHILGVSPQAIWNWIDRTGGEIPFKDRCVITTKFPSWFKNGEYRQDIRQALDVIGDLRESV